MKKLLYLALSFSLFNCTSPNGSGDGNSSITIELDSLANETVILEYLGTKERIGLDTIVLDETGKGKFNFNVDQVGFYSIYQDGQQGGAVFVAKEGDALKIKGNGKNLMFASKIEGSKEVERMDSMVAVLNDFRIFSDSLNRIYRAAQEKNMHYPLEEQFNQLYRERAIQLERYLVGFIQKNPEQFINLQAIRSLDINKYPDLYKMIDSTLFSNYSTSPYVQEFHQEVSKVLSLRIGGKAPDFSLNNQNSEPVSLSNFKGKYVLLDFWATWCKPCIQEIPYLKQAQTEFKNEAFEVVSICVDQENKKIIWKQLIEKHEANWTQLFDADGSVAQSYQLEGFPTIILLDPSGKIIDKGPHLRQTAYINKLNSIFKK